MSALNAALCTRGIILWLAAVLLLASRSTHSAPVYDQDTTQIAEYDGTTTGCYFNYQRYQEGDRIMTSEPCLNCTCHNRMLMCYLKVCPFTKAIGQDCTVEKRPDQCCPVITCSEVPVQLLTSTTSAPTSDSTEVGFHDNYGCHVDERFYADGAMLPLDHHNPCELCYCIRNRTTCLMQECTLQVAGCKPVYQPGVCCPIKYNCEYDEEPSTTVGPTPGLIMTTTLPPGVLSQCYYEGKVYENGDHIYSTQPCQKCYCFGGEIACAVQSCGTPMQEHGKNCTALPPPDGKCCPTTYQCEEEITTIHDEFPEQVLQDQITTKSPEQATRQEEDQQEILLGVDISQKGEEDNGIIEHITTETPEQQPGEQPTTLPAEEIELTTVEKESTPSYVTEISSTEITEEVGAAKPEASTTVQGTEESLITEASTAELPEASSIAYPLQTEGEMVTTDHVSEEVSTEENIIEKEPSTVATTEKEQPIEPAISEATQTEGSVKEEETTSPHEELSTPIEEEVTKIEKTTEEQISVTEIPEKPEISTEIEKATSPTEEPGISIVSESVSEQSEEDKGKPVTIPGEFLATQTESPKEEETVTVPHEISSTEQITEKEISHPTETAVTEEIQTEVSGPSEEQFSPITDKEFVSTEESHPEEESTSEIPVQGPTGIPIPEQSPEQKPEDEVYHVTEDYHGVTHPEIIPDNLVTESPQKIPTTYISPEQETTLVPSEETAKPIATESTEILKEGTAKPIPKDVTEISTQPKPEITTVSEEMKTESTPAIIKGQASTEPSATVAQEVPEEVPEISVPEGTAIPQTEIQLTEKTPSSEGMPSSEGGKGLNVGESGETSSEEISGETGKKKEGTKESKKEDEIEPPIATESAPEIPTFIPTEHSTIPSDLEKENVTEGEHITTVIPSEQSTHVPTQVEEKETEIVPVETEKSVTKKPVEEHPTEIPSITDEIEEESQITEEPVSKEEQTTVAIKTIETEEKLTTSTLEAGITEQPEQYSTKKALEEASVTESGPEETEYTKGVSTESVEQQTALTEKEPSEELKPTEVTYIKQTELPVEHPTEAGEIEEGEENVSVPVSTEEMRTEVSAIETGATETTTVETEKMQTEPSVSGEHIPSQPSIPSEEDIQPDEQITEKPEKEITEMSEEPQKPTVPSVEKPSHIQPLETDVESVLPEEKPVEGSTTESAGVGETVTPEQPEISSEQPEKVATEPSEQKEQTQESITKQRKEPETTSPAPHEEFSSTPEISEKPVKGEQEVSKTTEIAESEGTTIPILIPEASTELPFEETTKHEISIEEEITPATESVTSEKEQPDIQVQTTQPSIGEETPSKEGPIEISTEEGIIPEISEVPIIEETQKPEEEIIKKTGTTEMPDHTEKEEYSTVAPKEIPEVTSTTEILPEEVPQYTTNIPEEISVEGEDTSEITSRPSGIPGEGNCLVEGQSYNNNSAVPPANQCQTSCRCISSIVQCESVKCPPPPARLLNCMPVYTGGESCCPMYICNTTSIPEPESDSHVIESESQKTVPPIEISTEAATESSTLAGEISTPEKPVEIAVTSSDEEIPVERQQTIKPIETVYEQPTTVGQSIEHYPEKQTISPIPETSQESSSKLPEEEHTVPGETTEGKVNEEGTTKLAVSTEQPQEEIGEKQVTVGDEIITSTQVPIEQEPHGTQETVTVPTVTKETETSIPEVEVPVSTEKEEVTTIAAKDEETVTQEEEKPTEEKGIEEQTTLKPIEGIEKTQPKEPKVPLEPTSEEPVTPDEHEPSTKPEEIVTEKPEIPEEQKTVKPTEYEITSIPEIQSTTEYKPGSETEYKEEEEPETVTSTEIAQTEEPEIQTKLSGIAPSEIETQKPIIPTAESTTLIHDHTVSEGAPTEEYTTIKPVEVSTEESTKAEPEVPTQVPETEEHVTIPVLPVETELPGEETTKLVEVSTPEIPHGEVLPETTERIEKETTEHAEEQTEPSVTEHEEKPTTKSPEEKPSETESPVTEEPTKSTEAEAEHEKPTEISVPYESTESTQVSVEKQPEATPELSTEYPITEEILTTSVSEEVVGTERPVVPESETPVEEHVTAPIEHTLKSEEPPAEEQTVASPSIPEEKITESSVSTEVPVTSQEEQTIEKEIESVKPETQLPDIGEENIVIPKISESDKEQKPETEITEKPGKEEPTTIPELTEEGKIETEEPKEETATPASTTEYKEEEIEPVVTVQEPIETTTISKEQKPKEEITEASLPEHPVSEEATTVASLTPEEPTVKTEEQSTHEPEYQTTLPAAEEEVSKPATETSAVELPSKKGIITTESPEKPEEESVTKLEVSPGEEESVTKLEVSPGEEESVTKLEVSPGEEESVTKLEVSPGEEESVTKLEVSPTEKPEKFPSETEKPAESEQETELPEQGETTTKIIESAVTHEILPEEVIPVEVTPKVEEKPTEVSVTGEEAHSTEPSIETTSVHEEEPLTTKLQPTERPLPSEGETPAGEIQPTQPEEGEEGHPSVSEEGHPSTAEEPQFTTEHAPEEPVTITTEEQPETSSVATAEGSIQVSDMKPTELPAEVVTVPEVPAVPEVVTEEPESQFPISPQSETPPEEPVIKTQPTEIPIGGITEVPEEGPSHPQEGDIDNFPQATLKPEIPDIIFPEQRPVTTLAPLIPEYPDQSGISGEDTHFPMPGGSYPNPDDDYGDEDYGGPGTCRYGGKVYVSAQQIPRDDPCDFCFCFRSDIICLQQSCPPPIPGCHEEPINGFCCPRYECPVSMATALNLTTTTTTTTTTLPPHFHAHAYKGAARRSGCQVRGQAYRVGEVIKSASGPCLRCICGGDGNMNCDPRVCSPEPMLRQMIAATTDAKRRR